MGKKKISCRAVSCEHSSTSVLRTDLLLVSFMTRQLFGSQLNMKMNKNGIVLQVAFQRSSQCLVISSVRNLQFSKRDSFSEPQLE